jgi:hypothetical protein
LDKRRYNRITVDFAAAFSGDAYRARGTIINLSMLGCRARTTFSIRAGESIGVLIDVPEYDHPLYVSRAQVQWSDGDELGMEFIHMELEDRQRLAAIIRASEGAG